MNVYDMTNKMEVGDDHDCQRQQCVITENNIKNSQSSNCQGRKLLDIYCSVLPLSEKCH